MSRPGRQERTLAECLSVPLLCDLAIEGELGRLCRGLGFSGRFWGGRGRGGGGGVGGRGSRAATASLMLRYELFYNGLLGLGLQGLRVSSRLGIPGGFRV